MGIARNGGVELAYDAVGDPSGSPMLLVMGLGAAKEYWGDFPAALAGAGFRVARFDNRDSGRSSRHPEGYTLRDAATDAVAVMDAMRWESAHVLGVSMGGAIAQILAVDRPGRVRSLISVSSTPSASLRVVRPRLRAMLGMALRGRRLPGSAEEAAEWAVGLYRVIGSPGYAQDTDELRRIGAATFDPQADPAEVRAAAARHGKAMRGSGDRRAELARVAAPALVLHGDADPVVSRRAGRATAAVIPGARYVEYPGMGHDLPRELWPSIVAEVSGVARRADGRPPGAAAA